MNEAPTLHPPGLNKWTETLFKKDEGELELEGKARSVLLDLEFASPGVVFEPMKDRRRSFLYHSFQWCEGDEEEVVVMFSTHRIILRGKRLSLLPEHFCGQKVRKVCVLGRADSLLADTGEVKTPVVTEIKIDRLNDEGEPGG